VRDKYHAQNLALHQPDGFWTQLAGMKKKRADNAVLM
jgi:hypothetical protein